MKLFFTQNKAGRIRPSDVIGDEEPQNIVNIIIPDEPTADGED